MKKHSDVVSISVFNFTRMVVDKGSCTTSIVKLKNTPVYQKKKRDMKLWDRKNYFSLIKLFVG